MAKSSGKAGSLFYGMSLETTDFKKKLKDARKTATSIGKKIRDNFTTIAKGASIVTGAFAAGSAAMLAFAKSTAEATNAQILLGNEIGATQGEIAGLELSAEKLGVETSMLIDKVREFGGVDAFKKYADQVKDAGDEQAQITKAIELFGGEGAKMVGILKQGSEGLNAMEQEAIALGLALSPQQIAQTTAAWGQFEDTMMRLKGLGRQVGTALLEPFGLASAAIGGFVKTFKKDIINGFSVVSDFMSMSIRKGISVFAEYGIPVINSFINVANQIGEAFATIFNFIGGSSVFGSVSDGIKEISNTLITFISNFKQIFISGVTGAIGSTINFAFRSLAKFNEFIGDILGTIAFAAGQDDLGFSIVEEFGDQAQKFRLMGKDLAKPFELAMEEADKRMSENIQNQADKNLKNQLAFKGLIVDFQSAFDKSGATVSESIKKSSEAAVKLSKASDKTSGLAVTGSQEEFRQRANQEQISIDIERKNLKANEKTSKALSGLGVF